MEPVWNLELLTLSSHPTLEHLVQNVVVNLSSCHLGYCFDIDLVQAISTVILMLYCYFVFVRIFFISFTFSLR